MTKKKEVKKSVPSNTKKDKMISLRMNSKQYEAILKNAKKMGKTRTDYILWALNLGVVKDTKKPYPFQKL